MKKILLGTAAGLFLTAANADCGCCDTSFTGVFLGASVDFSFDQAKVGSDVYGNDGVIDSDRHYATTKKNKTAFGGAIILGYRYQFCNGLTLGLSHESLFASKAKATFSNIMNDADDAYVSLESTRKCYSPAFYIDLGYVVDNWHFGIKNGIAIERFNIERGLYDGNNFAKYNKSFTQVSYVLGAFVEYKINAINVFTSVKYKFARNKTLDVINNDGDMLQRIKHKRPGWEVSVGVTCNPTHLFH